MQPLMHLNPYKSPYTYILQDHTGKALAWGNGAFRAVEPVTDEDGTYYHSDPEVYFRWCIEYDAAETG